MKIFDPQLTGSIEVENPISGSVTTLGNIIALGSDSSLSGSFSGSFSGDGAGITGAGWDGQFTGSATISGSLNIVGDTEVTISSSLRAEYFGVWSGSYAGYLAPSGELEGNTTNDLGLGSETGKNIRFYTNKNTTEKMRLTTDGNLGIGIAPSSTTSLHIYKSDPILLIQASNTSGDAELQFFPRDGSNVAHLQSIKGNGSNLVFSTGGNSGNSYVPTEALTISSGGAATFSGNINATNASSTVNIIATGINSGTNGGSSLIAGTTGVTNIAIGNKSAILGGAFDATSMVYWGNGGSLVFNNGANRLTISSGGDATFSGSVGIGTNLSVGVSGENNITALSGSKTWIGSNRLRYNTASGSATGTFARSSATEQGAMMILTDTAQIEFYTQPSLTQTGTYSLTPKLTISSGGALTINASANSTGTPRAIGFGGNSIGTNPLIYYDNAGNLVVDSTNSGKVFLNGDTTGDVILALGGGNVGIGTSTLNSTSRLTLLESTGNGQTLEIIGANSGASGSQPGIRFTGSSGQNIGGIYADTFSNNVRIQTGGTERLTISSGGAATFSSSAAIAGGLAVGTGTQFATSIFFASAVLSAGAGTYPLKWNSSTGIVTYDTSSRLVKKNIQNSPYGLLEVLQLQPRKYFRTDDKKEEIGFIADEIQKILPEFVPMVEKSLFTKNEEDIELIPGGVNYEKLTAVLVKAIQEQQAQIEELKSEIQLLKNN